MAFKLADFKKTTRGSGETRVIYPHQIRDDRHTAAISYALAYFERMVGRRRGEFEVDALLEFFGDPRLARGLVACLAGTYTWRSPDFAEALGAPAAEALHRAGVERPADLRARLYELVNTHHGGFVVPAERTAVLRELGNSLAAKDKHPARQSVVLTPEQIDLALGLDAEDQQLLVKLGPTPAPDEVVARYNYHSIETALCYAEKVHLRLVGPVWPMLRSAHNLARRYRLSYSVGDLPSSLFDDRLDLTFHGRKDALGGWGRAGRRMARALLRLLAAHPGCAREGEALTHAGGRKSTLRLDTRALRTIGATDVETTPDLAWDNIMIDDFQRDWGKALLRGRTAGWRLRRDPEPLVGSAALVVPEFVLRRGRQGLALCLAPSRATGESLAAGLAGIDSPAVVLAHTSALPALRGSQATVVTYSESPSDAVPRLVATLERSFPRSSLAPAPTPWQTLEQRVSAEGFVDETSVASILGCAPEEAARLVRRWGGSNLHVLSGLGICDGETLADIRQLLERAA